jgi:hypothetical protein
MTMYHIVTRSERNWRRTKDLLANFLGMAAFGIVFYGVAFAMGILH